MELKNSILFIVLTLCSLVMRSQDTIITIDNDTLKVDIVELSFEEVHYKIWNDNNEIYKFEREDLSKILFTGIRNKKSRTSGKSLPVIYEAKKRNIYLVEDVKSVSSFWHLEEYMEQDPKAKFYFRNAKRYQKYANISGLGAITSLTYGLIKIDKHKNEYHDLFNGGLLVGQFFTYIITPVYTLSGIILVFSAKILKKKAFDAYGVKSLAEMNYYQNSEMMECKFGVTQNGIGLVLNF